MDPVTHTLTGALIGQAGLKRKTGLAMPALLIGANLPDIDVACFLWLDGVEHLAFRRGITHGPIAWVLLPLLLAGALWWFDRWQVKRRTRPEGRLPVRFGWLYGLSLIACLTHPALDWLNVYGVRLLEPFSSRWFYGDVLFIVDVWLWAITGVGLWLSLRKEQLGGNSRRPALIGVVLGLAYINANFAISRMAMAEFEAEGAKDVIPSPVPLTFWEREIIIGGQMEDYGGQAILADWSLLPNQARNGRILGSVDDLLTCSDLPTLAESDAQLRAFLLWSRSPITEIESGDHYLRDARFYDPRARGRFSLNYDVVDCYEPAGAS